MTCENIIKGAQFELDLPAAENIGQNEQENTDEMGDQQSGCMEEMYTEGTENKNKPQLGKTNLKETSTKWTTQLQRTANKDTTELEETGTIDEAELEEARGNKITELKRTGYNDTTEFEEIGMNDNLDTDESMNGRSKPCNEDDVDHDWLINQAELTNDLMSVTVKGNTMVATLMPTICVVHSLED